MMPYRAEDSNDNNLEKRFLDYIIDKGKISEENSSPICEGINMEAIIFVANFL